jgi:Transposase, Mutator family
LAAYFHGIGRPSWATSTWIGCLRSIRPRNGTYRRHLLTELGEIELAVPRTRRFAPIAVVRAYARRAEQLDRMILVCFVLGLSVRKSLPSRRRGSAKRCCQSWDGRSAQQR